MEALREQWMLLITTPIYIVVILGEIFWSNFRKSHSYTFWDTLTNLYLMILNSAIDVFFRSVYVVILAMCYENRMLDWTIGIWYWLALIVAEDFVFYWLHRVDHHSRFFWAVHVTHHSSEKYNLTTGFRSSVFQPLYRFVYFLPLAFLGFKPLDIVFIFSATQTWGILVHTEHVGKLGILEYFLVTPSHHRVHHASNALYLDRNLGMLLIIWDKIFGTFQAELPAHMYQPIRYGLTKPAGQQGPVEVVAHEWKNIWKDLRKSGKLRDKLRYIFGAPGWSHDGSTLTSHQLRQMEAGDRPESAGH
ncbi:MAG: sterol desaturase family protein [Bacteroidetes bacterium]|nr:sterol desaturase family protein [Bacteroidota bacterium]